MGATERTAPGGKDDCDTAVGVQVLSCVPTHKRELNVMADLLSFEGDDWGEYHPIVFDNPANDKLTDRFLKHFPSQVPTNFAISQLPTEIQS